MYIKMYILLLFFIIIIIIIFLFYYPVSVDSPLYIRPHSKTVLSLAVSNDTQFLASHLIMDYSLLVGLDETKQELVLGIIGRLSYIVLLYL